MGPCFGLFNRSEVLSNADTIGYFSMAACNSIIDMVFHSGFLSSIMDGVNETDFFLKERKRFSIELVLK